MIDAIREVLDRVRKPQELGGFLYRPNDWSVEDPNALQKPGPAAKTLDVHTLGALRDYLTANRDGLQLNTLVVYVASPAKVLVAGPLRERRDREFFLAANAVDLTEGFLGVYKPIEEFVVGLQTRFAAAPDDNRRVLALLSNVKHETVKQSTDDGVTQVVQSKAGVVLVQDSAVPNPVQLTPFRTFRDIVQPASPFVLRVANDPRGHVQAGLFEADGGAWKLSTVDRIRDWLKEQLPQGIAILG